ncbi:MAG TPA: LuxR C-terminal-related transcriptional regulator [Solirubrobacteraceae bacterium]
MREWSPERVGERIERVGRDCGASRALRRALLKEISGHVRVDAYAWLLCDPETEVGCDPVADVPCMPQLPKLIRLKYATDTNRWTRMKTPVARLLVATDGRPERSLVWRELLAAHDVIDVASLVFRDRFGCWAFLDLWRVGSAEPFTDRDAAYLQAIASPVTAALRRAQAKTFHIPDAAPAPAGPAVLVLSPDLRVRAQTPETEAYLRALVPPAADRQPIPAGAYNVGAQMLACEHGVDGHPPRARVHLGQGVWMTLRAARIVKSDMTDPDIAVTIEPTSPNERMGLFSLAHGLTKREAEIVAACARGRDTRDLARELFVSENTVQDHFKSIFAKALLISAGLALLVPAAWLVGEGRLLAGVVAALLIALEVGLLLGVQMLLIPTALELLRVYAELIEQSCVLLRIYLIDSLQLLRGLLVISTELAYQMTRWRSSGG